ncbi:MAG: hypothetical protein KDK08_18875 [Rhizobiaceae bacterium]|nr:hypothetical protein [Rhizobiaceae bacterium]
MTQTRILALLLVLSAVNLALMVPGGFIETRNFPGYSVAVLAAFNVFLTLLGFASLVLAYRIVHSGRIGTLPALAGAAFTAIYLLDLATLFPVTTVPMSTTLAAMEWIGAVLGVALIVHGGRLAFVGGERASRTSRLPPGLTIAMGVTMLAIIVFATVSAM